MMKIVHIYGSISRMHGATKWVMAFASELKNRGYDSSILCTRFHLPRPYWLTADIKAVNDETAEPEGGIGRVVANYRQVLGLVRHLPPDTEVVVLHTEATVPLLALVRFRCRRARVVYYCYQPPREVYDLWDVVKRDLAGPVRLALQVGLPFYKWLDRSLVRRADRVLVWSEEYRRYAQDIYGDLPYALVPAGVDFHMFELPPEKVARKRQEIGAGFDYVLLMNASLTRKKNVDIFIRLLAALAGEGLLVRGVVIGEGPLQAELETLAVELGVAERLLLTGYVSQEELPYFYYVADILYYLEPNGAWTMSVIEAGAARRPVIVAPGGSMPTLVRHEETGYILAHVHDPAELLARTVGLLEEPALWQELGRQNYEHCRQFSLEQSATNFLDAIAQLD